MGDHSLPGVRVLDIGGIAGALTNGGVHTVQFLKVASSSAPDLRTSHQYRAICHNFTVEQMSGCLRRQDESQFTTSGLPLPRRLHGPAPLCPSSPHVQPHASALGIVRSYLRV